MGAHRAALVAPQADTSAVVPKSAGPVTLFQHSYIVSAQGAAGHDVGDRAQCLAELC
jgi:hypothetical protein